MEHKRAEVVVRRVCERDRMTGWEVGSSFLSPPTPVFGDANCKFAFDGGHTSCSFIVQIREAIQERVHVPAVFLVDDCPIGYDHFLSTCER